MNIKQVKQAIIAARAVGRTPNLIGLHGTGKSAVVKQVAKEMGLHYKEFRTGQAADAGDLTGLPQFKLDDKGREYTHFVLPDWFPREENTLVFFDEINRGAKDILNGAFEAVYDLSMKGIPMPKGSFIVSACNPPTDNYVGTIDFADSAFQDRFIHIKFKPTFDEFRGYAKEKFPSSVALEYLGEHQKMVEDQGLEDFQLDFVKPSRRSWEAAMQLEELFEAGELDKDVFVEMMYGLVGSAATTAYLTFRETNVGSIRAIDVIENYAKVQKNVLRCVEKNRTDIIANLLVDIGEELSKRKGLELNEANNLKAVIKDLTPEQAYTLCTIFTTQGTNHETCSNVNGMPAGGLLYDDELVDFMEKSKKLREKAAADIEKAKAKTAKKKSKTEEEL